MIASISTNRTAKKAALIHLTFNVIGTIIFMLILPYFKQFILNFTSWTNAAGNIKREIANAHTFFNIVNTILLAPFIPQLIKFVNWILPGDGGAETFSLKYLDERIIETPSIAVGQTVKEAVRMGSIAANNVQDSMDAFFKESEPLIASVYEKEELINYLEKEVTGYLVKLSQKSLTERQSETVTSLFHTLNDLERIGDHAENIVELAQYRIDNKLKFSDSAVEELNQIFSKVYGSVMAAVKSLETHDLSLAMQVINDEKDIDAIEKKFRTEHIDRLNKGVCTPASGTVFLDLISNLERVADHANNIAQAVAGKLDE
jgi:phosphate:Na+ symporter